MRRDGDLVTVAAPPNVINLERATSSSPTSTSIRWRPRVFGNPTRPVPKRRPTSHRFHQYVNEDDNKISVVQVHPDADSMEFFMQEVLAKHGVQAYEYLEEPRVRRSTARPATPSWTG